MRAAYVASGAAIVGLAIAAAILVVGIPEAEAPDAGALPVTREALKAHVERAPRDGRAWVLLARAELDADRFREAADAYERGLAASRKAALDQLTRAALEPPALRHAERVGVLAPNAGIECGFA